GECREKIEQVSLHLPGEGEVGERRGDSPPVATGGLTARRPPVDRLRQPATGGGGPGRAVPRAAVTGKEAGPQQGGGLLPALVRGEGAPESACQSVALGAVVLGKRQGNPAGQGPGEGAGHGQACCSSGDPRARVSRRPGSGTGHRASRSYGATT